MVRINKGYVSREIGLDFFSIFRYNNAVMILQNMLKLFLYTTLLCVYFIFSQVYPYVHIHARYLDDAVEIFTVFHPVETCHLVHNSGLAHDHHNNQNECHNHHSNGSQHFYGDWHVISAKAAPRLPKFLSIPVAGQEIVPAPGLFSIHANFERFFFPCQGITRVFFNKSPPTLPV